MLKPSQLTKTPPVYLCSFFEQSDLTICLLCLGKCSAAQGICNECLLSLPTLQLACQKCKEPLSQQRSEDSDERLLCPRCQKEKRTFDDCITGLVYQTPVSDMLQRIKFNRRIVYLKPLTQHLLNRLEDHYCDTPWPKALIPVPMHWWKQRKRGFNQADLIANQLSRVTEIPVLHKHVRKIQPVQAQFRLSAKKRQRNIRHTFSINKPIACNHVAIVDDVMTTGATAEELCRVLINHGVNKVDIWCLARTPPVHFS